MAISQTDKSEASRNVRSRLSTDQLLAKLRAAHGDRVRQTGEVCVRRRERPRQENEYDNGANDRNSPAPPDLHLFQAVALLDG
jgi:hypothetical protein